MIPRTLQLAYAFPSIVALILTSFFMTEMDAQGIIGPTSMIRVSETGDSRSNAQVVRAVNRVASTYSATLLRAVADRTAPSTKREVLVTTAPGSWGVRALTNGYRDFNPALTTKVSPMADLTRFDPTGEYQVVGAQTAVSAFEDAFHATGYETERFAVPSLAEAAVRQAVGSGTSLLMLTTLTCVVLCLIGTLGTPRRLALRRLSGLSPIREIRTETRVGAYAATVAGGGLIITGGALLVYNGLAQIAEFGLASGYFLAFALLPVIAAHFLGCSIARRMSIPDSMRGRRPAGQLMGAVLCARMILPLLLVPSVFMAVASAAVVTAAQPDRELRAAGETVDLWVTPDPRPGSLEEPYWERLGTFARNAMFANDAFLAAKLDIAPVGSTQPQLAMVVDENYLARQPLRSRDDRLVRAEPHAVTVWLPETRAAHGKSIVRELKSWYLRDAKAPEITAIKTGVLARGQQSYSYSTSESVAPWLKDTVIIVVPRGGTMFDDGLMGAWISTTDVVFTSAKTAQAQLRSHGVEHEISAIVPIGQAAAERAREAGITAENDLISALAAGAVALGLQGVAIVVTQRRFSARLFARSVAGRSFVQSNRELMAFECGICLLSIFLAIGQWWDSHPESTGRNSAMDPAASSSSGALLLTLIVGCSLLAIGFVTTAATARRTIRDHGKET